VYAPHDLWPPGSSTAMGAASLLALASDFAAAGRPKVAACAHRQHLEISGDNIEKK
jgi:hypothetical protein